MKGKIAYALMWVVAVLVAITVGLAAVRTVGEAVRGRGPLGSDVARADAVRAPQRPQRPDPDAEVVTRELTDEFGTFEVSCRGVYALGKSARASGRNGWRVISFEPGPDDDVDAVFSNRHTIVEIEVFCNRGRPTVAEIERSRLADD